MKPGAAPRVPERFGGIQVNFCKNPACANFAVPVPETAWRGKASHGAQSPYTLTGTLARVSRGIYVKARPSSLTGNPAPVIPLVEIGLLALAKLGVQADVGTFARAYNKGRTTQIPMATLLSVGSARVTRRIGFGKQVIRLER